MNRAETAQLLTKIAAFDRRTIGEADVLAWHEIMEDYPLRDALAAVSDYFRDTREWCMPSDIVSRVKAIHRERSTDVGPVWPNDPPLREDLELNEAERIQADEARRDHRTLIRLVQHGELDRAAYQDYKDSGLSLADWRNQRKALTA